ncbi:23S rRNA pseudouridine(1911/1915/1917) synthase RluD [Candidatus Providencia siddallii]|uniref:Pseudouridine synthase n=1 Tax=Candidatus Providencia siddallii TaxID=1715285 RepID=A0ABP1CE93_9GAMM
MQKTEFNTIINNLQVKTRLDHTLVKLLPSFSRTKIKKLILLNKVKINDKIINKPKKYILNGEKISINFFCEKKTSYLKPQNITLNIIFEDNDILVINKPDNLIVHPGVNNSENTILNALLYHYPKSINIPRAGIVHRLDKNTTGLMIIAKNIPSYRYLINSLQLKQITREYEAIVSGKIITGGSINKPISRHPIKRTQMSVNKNGKQAITHYRIIEHFRIHTRLLVRLETGRTHQILVHMAHINHPLLGKSLYNNKQYLNKKNNKYLKEINNFNRQALHAIRLHFNHPTSKKRIKLYASLPDDMIKLIKNLKYDMYLNKNNI